MIDDLTSYYLLGYNSTNATMDGRFRRIEVRVKGPGIHVRARRGYRAPTREEVAAKSAADSAASGPSPLVEAMGRLGRIGDDARFHINVAAYFEGEEATIWVAGELPGRTDEFSAGATADMEIQAGEYSTRASVVLDPGERGFVTSVTLRATGPADVNVRARLTGQGSVEPLTDTMRTRLGTGGRPLMFRRGPSTGNRLLPAAVLEFPRAERLRLELPVAPGTKPGAARMLDRAGNELHVPVRVGEKADPATGQHWITADVVLAPLAAGDYAIEQAPEGMEKVITAIRVTR